MFGGAFSALSVEPSAESSRRPPSWTGATRLSVLSLLSRLLNLERVGAAHLEHRPFSALSVEPSAESQCVTTAGPRLKNFQCSLC